MSSWRWACLLDWRSPTLVCLHSCPSKPSGLWMCQDCVKYEFAHVQASRIDGLWNVMSCRRGSPSSWCKWSVWTRSRATTIWTSTSPLWTVSLTTCVPSVCGSWRAVRRRGWIRWQWPSGRSSTTTATRSTWCCARPIAPPSTMINSKISNQKSMPATW